MFKNCYNLGGINMYASILKDNSLLEWTQNVRNGSKGGCYFYKNKYWTTYEIGENGIPYQWKITNVDLKDM